MDVVEAVARRRSDLHHMDGQEYRVLHSRITTTCKELAGSGDEARRKLYEDLEATVQPWLSPRVLAHADSEILAHLLVRCRTIERELGGRAWARAIRRPAALALFLIVAATLAVVTVWSARGLRTALAEGFQDVSNAIRLVLWRSSDLEKWSALAVVVILLSIYNVSRTARS
jgi:hypothetical protein